MEIDCKIFTKEKIWKALLKFSFPAMLALLIIELYSMVDTIFLGIKAGPAAIGALTIAFPVQRLMSSLGMMVAVGASTACSRSLGSNNHKKLKGVIKNSINITIIIMVVLTCIMLIFKKQVIIGVLGASSNIYPLSEKYISIVIFGGVFQALTLVFCYIMTAMGDTKITLKANGLGALLNIFIDYILVINLSFGVEGAAIATVGSQIIAFIYAFIKMKKNVELNIELSIEGKIVKNILAVGLSTFIVEVSDAIVAIILNNLLASYGGDTALIMVGVTTKISMFLFVTVIGISSSMQPIAAFNYGAKKIKKIIKVVKITVIFATIATLILWGLMFIFSYPIIGSFLKDKSLLNDSVRAFRIVILVFPIISIYYISIYYYQAIGKAKSSFLLSIYRQIIIFIPILFLLLNKFGILGAWIAYPVSDIISAFTGIVYLRYGLRKIKKSNNEDVLEERRKLKLKIESTTM